MEDQKQSDHQSHEIGKFFSYVSNASWKNFQHTEQIIQKLYMLDG
jgi:hypothetical protein